MTKISSKTAYPKKKPISSDYFVGTDSEDFNKTVNFGFEEVAGLVNDLNGTPILNYVFSTSPYLSTEVLLEGRFLSDENELSTPSLTKLYINKFNNSGDNLQELYLFLQANATDFYLKLRNSNNQNNAVYFDIASIEDFPDYFILNITVFKENEFLPLLENLNVYFFDFELKATSAGTSDPLKLDKDGYTGTAKEIDDRILVLENQTDVDNAFITKPTFSLSANTLTIDALGKWKLEGVIYENPASVAFPITLCTAGKTRLDYFVPNNANGFTKVSGIETLGLAIAPQLPNENIYVTYVLVTDSGVGEPVIPPAVVTPNLQQVLESGFSTTKRIWFWNTLNSKCTRFASDHILFQKLESVFNFIRADNTTQSYNIQLPNKIGGAEQTFAMVSDLTKSQVGLSNVDNTSDANKPVSTAQQAALDFKLDASAYNEYFKGKYTSSGALTTAYPTATDGDYAIVDAGTGVDAKEWIWDNEAGWIVGGATGASTTDALPEGSTNLYWTVARFLANLTAANIKAALGITTLSGSNTGDQDLSGKQDVLVSGTNIKTLDGDSLIGSGNLLPKTELAYALSDETSNLTVGTLITFRMPFAMTLSDVRISLNNAPTISSVIVNVKENGVSIFSTLLSIDASEKTSVTAATPAVISDVNLADDAEITVETTQIGSGDTGKGLKILFKGRKA